MREFAGSWRVALRVARRSAWRNKARSLLIVLMLMLPVYAGTLVVLSWHSVGLSGDRDAEWALGRADLLLQGDLPAIRAALPPGSRSIPAADGRTVVATPTGHAAFDYEAVDAADPMVAGRYRLRTGRVARQPGEVAVTDAVAKLLHVRVGDSVSAGLPSRRHTIVGIVDVSRSLAQAALVVPADAPLSAAPRRGLLVQLPPGAASWSPETAGRPLGESLSYMSRASLAPKPTDRALRAAAVALTAGFAAAQVALLAGAAFAIGARRQRRQLGRIAAVGATGRQAGRIVLAGGVVLGAAAGAAGLTTGLATAGLIRPLAERLLDHPLVDTGIPWARLAAVAALALATGTLAALGPARTTTRQTTPAAATGRAGVTGRAAATGAAAGRGRAAVTGRAAVPRRARWWLVVGALLVAAGVAATVVGGRPTGRAELVVAGAVTVLLGLAAVAPGLAGAAGRGAGRLPLAARLAVRNAARHQFRTGAATAAVMAAMAGSVALIGVNAAERRPEPGTRDATPGHATARTGQVLLPETPVTAATVGRLARLLPVRAVVPVTAVTGDLRPARYWQQGAPEAQPEDLSSIVAVGGPEIIRIVTGRDATPAELDALRAGRAVALHPDYLRDGRITLSPEGAGDRPPIAIEAVAATAARATDRATTGRTAADRTATTDRTAADRATAGPTATGRTAADRAVYADLPGIVIPPATAQRLGLPVAVVCTVFDTTRQPTAAEYAAANDVVLAAEAEAPPGTVPTPVQLTIAAPPKPPAEPVNAMFLLLAGASALVSMAASAVAVALAAADTRPDLSVMTAVGAGPRLRRRMAAVQAGLIVGGGTLLGLAAGTVPAAGLVAYSTTLVWHTPWLGLAITVVGAPLAAVALATAGTPSRLVPARQST